MRNALPPRAVPPRLLGLPSSTQRGSIVAPTTFANTKGPSTRRDSYRVGFRIGFVTVERGGEGLITLSTDRSRTRRTSRTRGRNKRRSIPTPRHRRVQNCRSFWAPKSAGRRLRNPLAVAGVVESGVGPRRRLAEPHQSAQSERVRDSKRAAERVELRASDPPLFGDASRRVSADQRDLRVRRSCSVRNFIESPRLGDSMKGTT